MPRLRPLSLAFALGATLSIAAPSLALDGIAGPYLAGQAARTRADFAAAAQYYTQSLMADPRNIALLENAIVAQIGVGAVDRAVTIAKTISKGEAGDELADLTILADLARQGAYEQALAELDAGRTAGELVDGLYRAWVLVGLGQMSDATGAFDKLSASEGLRAFGLYHKALALASAGDFEGADKIFSGEEGGPLRATRRGVLAHAQVLSQLERNADALDLIAQTYGSDADPSIMAVRDSLQAGEVLPFTMITSPADGIAEVYYTVASALAGDPKDINLLAFSRLAEYVRPGHADAIILTAAALEAQGQFDLATEAYARIGHDDPAFIMAELGRANALIQSDKTDAAIEVLQELAKTSPGSIDVWTALGDTLREQERFTEAAEAYDNALATVTQPREGHWVLFYARGIAHERAKTWPQAEADFRKALELKPDQPQVLNYLGYSYLEMKQNLDEAMAMIERAVLARPDDGYIVDSLGWALYRLGRYDEAVVQMERAVELTPVDSIINDHLGDVYWAVGRRLEAEFQWRRALSFEPETEAEAERIRQKLAIGLDEVLAAEGADPLAVSTNGN